MNHIICPLVLICLLSGLHTCSENIPAQGGGDCSVRGMDDATRGKAVIFGREFVIPKLRLRFVDNTTGRAVVPKVVNIHYLWQWIEHPYPEHRFGAWVDAEEWVQCSTKGANELVVPARTIQPRGWYSGLYTALPWQKPKFSRLEIVIELSGCAPRLIVNPGDLERYKETTAIVKLPCAGRAEVDFER